MSDTLWAAIVGGIAGIIAGGLSSIVAPWANWRIERKRQQIEERSQAIRRWREMIMGWRFYADHNRPGQLYLERQVGWVSLEPHLKPAVLHNVGRYRGREITRQERDEFVDFMLVEVAKLEKKWKLV